MIAAGPALDLLVRSSLLLAMAWAAAGMVGKVGGSAAMRHLVWLLGLGALIALPFLSAVAPPLPLPIVPDVFQLPAQMAEPLERAASASGRPAAAEPAAAPGLGQLLWLTYLAVALALLVRLASGYFLLARLWKEARPAPGAQWTDLVEGLAASLGIRRPVALRIAAGPAMPMTWGTIRSRVLLPADALSWSDERRRIVLLHELAHVARRDSFSRTAAAIACALYWPHPAIWYSARRMRLEQEHACDDLVLSQGAQAHDYARSLLEIAGRLKPAAAAAGLSVAMARTSQLEQRLTAIVGGAPRRRASARFLAGSGTAALAATVLVATVAPVRALQPVQAPRPSVFGPGRASAPLPAELPLRRAAARHPDLVVEAAVGPAAAPPRPVVASRPVIPAQPAEPAADYESARRQYERDLDTYYRDRARYDAELQAHLRQVEELRSEDNLANSGNTGNTGNTGNYGQPGRPAHRGQPGIPAIMPISPTSPTSPTPPSPRHRHPRTATSQGP